MFSVTLSVVSHGHHRHVESLLRDLAQQTISNQLLVVLTLNIPEPEINLASFAPLQIRVIRNAEPKGFGANHNQALCGACSPWVMIVNPDIRIYDANLIARLIHRPLMKRTGIVAPAIYNSSGQREDAVRGNLDPISLFKRCILGNRTFADQGFRSKYFVWIAGMFMALPTDAWRAVEGFDDRFFLYCEDYDLCARLDRRGFSIEIDEGLKAIHDAQRSSRTSFKYSWWHLTSLIRVWASSNFWRIWGLDILGQYRRER